MAGKKKDKTLHVPTAPFRPGDEASFEPWPWKPGDLKRPNPKKCSADDTQRMHMGSSGCLATTTRRRETGIRNSVLTSCVKDWSIWSDSGYSMIA